jgi:hypothetical protein
MKGIHIFSPEIDRKVVWYCSVIFMVLAWLLLAVPWGFIVVASIFEWSKTGVTELVWEAYVLLAAYLVVLIVIPIQLVRYFRERRG